MCFFASLAMSNMTPKYKTNFISFLDVIRIEKPVELVQLDTLATVRHIQCRFQ